VNKRTFITIKSFDMGEPEKTTKPLIKPAVTQGPFFAPSVAQQQVQREPAKPAELTPEQKAANRKKIDSQQHFWEDLKKFFPGEDQGRKFGGSGYEESADYLIAKFEPVTAAGARFPTMYVGKEYMAEKDEDKRKAMIQAELDKVDQFRFDNALIDNGDKADEKILAKLRPLTIPQKQEFIGKLGNQKFIQNEDMQKAIARMIPSTAAGADAVFTAGGGFELQYGNVKIIVKPDVPNSSEPKKPTGAVTKTNPINNDEFSQHSGSPAARLMGNKVTDIDPFPAQAPQLIFEVVTYYGPQSGPDVQSGYGVGTRPEDTGDKKTLRSHEGSHGTVFINFIRDNITSHPFPVFTGKVGDTKAKFDAATRDFGIKARAFLKMISDAQKASQQDVDCVGTTIEQDATAHGEVSDVRCERR
jgi:hypothetical protein